MASATTPLLSTAASGEAPPQTHRYEFLDLFRGFIMLLMAWDHVTHHFTSYHDSVHQPGFEMWEGPFASFDNSPKKFLARSVSHICAPGFFFTMGISMTMFASNRRAKYAWTWGQVFQYYLVRGAVLLAVEYLINFPNGFPKLVDKYHGREVRSWIDGSEMQVSDILLQSLFGVYEVMTALGLTTMFAPLVLPLFFRFKHASTRLGWFLFFGVFLLSTLVIVSNQDLQSLRNPNFPHAFATCNNVFEIAQRFLFLPGTLIKSWQLTVYPLFPWLGLTLLGQAFGFELLQNKGRFKWNKQYALLLLGMFAMIRAFGGKLNFRGTARGEDVDASALMRFFLQSKYPPDLCYAAITLAVNLLLLELFSTNWLDYVSFPLLVFGRTPLFFYVLHFWAIAIFQALFRLPAQHPSGKFDLEYVVFIWIIILVFMFQACVRYYEFKSKTHPNSLWRLF